MIAVKSLTKRYGRIAAVSSLTFDVTPGTVTGFLGPNGSRLRDGTGWRAIAYVLLKLPLALLGCCVLAALWIGGLFYLTYPVWWGNRRVLAVLRYLRS